VLCLFDFDARIARVAQPLAHVLLQASTNQMADGGGRRRWQRIPVWLSGEDGSEDVRDGFTSERAPAGEGLV
jgi:hypothetical protein